ncbi:MAG: hypothetical protein E6713_10385 [Sporomusaceae bacterium]|nr:hypothetical protein [Sporomusaceae bacterium]
MISGKRGVIDEKEENIRISNVSAEMVSTIRPFIQGYNFNKIRSVVKMIDKYDSSPEKKAGMEGEYYAILDLIKQNVRPEKITWYLFCENDRVVYFKFVNELQEKGVLIEVSAKKQLNGVDFVIRDDLGNLIYCDAKARFNGRFQDIYIELKGNGFPYSLPEIYTTRFAFVLEDRTVKWIDLDENVFLTMVNDPQFHTVKNWKYIQEKEREADKKKIKAFCIPFEEFETKVCVSKARFTLKNPNVIQTITGNSQFSNIQKVENTFGVKIRQLSEKRTIEKNDFSIRFNKEKSVGKR